MAFEIFLQQGSNLCLLYWQTDFFLSFFLTTEPPGKPELFELLCYKKNTLSCTQTLIGTANKSFTEKYLSKLTSECEMHFGLFINKNAGRDPLNWCYGHK